MRCRLWLWRCALVLSLGAVGVLLAVLSRTPLGKAYRRRSADCVVCRRHRRRLGAAVCVVAAVVLVGSGLGLYQRSLSHDPRPCGEEWFLRGEVPQLKPSRDMPSGWQAARSIVTVPATSLAHGYAGVRGMELCTVGDLTIASTPMPGEVVTGTTVGDVMLTRVEPGLSGSEASELGRHESRHVDQWTIATLAAGPLALPVLYALDETFFPGSRNHFERAAGLTEGGYDDPPDFGPEPVWGGVASIAVIAGILWRHWVRWLFRVLRTGGAARQQREPGRCPLHSRSRHITGPSPA